MIVRGKLEIIVKTSLCQIDTDGSLLFKIALTSETPLCKSIGTRPLKYNLSLDNNQLDRPSGRLSP